jgi:hypothetical protein
MAKVEDGGEGKPCQQQFHVGPTSQVLRLQGVEATTRLGFENPIVEGACSESNRNATHFGLDHGGGHLKIRDWDYLLQIESARILPFSRRLDSERFNCIKISLYH